MLIASPRHRADDLTAWQRAEAVDAINAARTDWSTLTGRALDAIAAFAAGGACYAGTSWGKDSTVLAHLVWRLATERGVIVPLVWVRVEPIANPDCAAVRDAVLARWPHPYREEVVHCYRDAAGWHARGTLECGFRAAGRRHVSGVRAEESGARTLRMRRYGTTTANTCAPIGWWSAATVYAYLYHYELPVHPAYACSFGGRLDRDRLRVASLGGRRGDGMGRTEWERAYYRERLVELAL